MWLIAQTSELQWWSQFGLAGAIVFAFSMAARAVWGVVKPYVVAWCAKKVELIEKQCKFVDQTAAGLKDHASTRHALSHMCEAGKAAAPDHAHVHHKLDAAIAELRAKSHPT